MKIGFRTPNLKKAIKARTTGKIKRSLKKSVNPVYGKKGIGLITDPKKAIYNKVYKKKQLLVDYLVLIQDPAKSILFGAYLNLQKKRKNQS